MWTRSLIGILLAGVLAGCFSGPTATAPEDGPVDPPFGLLPDGSPVPTEYDITSCTMPTGFLPVPRDRVEPLLPDGFRIPPYVGDGTGGTETGTLIAAIRSCDDFRGEPLREFIALVVVEPPAALADENASHYLLLSWVTMSPTVAAITEAWGAGDLVDLGEVAVEATQGPAPGVLATGAGSGGGDRFELRVAAGGELNETTALLRAFVVRDRKVVSILEEEHEITWYPPLQGASAFTVEGSGPVGTLGPFPPGLGAHVVPEGDRARFRSVPMPDGWTGGSG